jgi:excisionase family DNA binding protein
MIGLTEEIGAGVRAKAQDDFEAIGLTLKTFYVGNLKPSDKSAEELRQMGMLDMATYTQLQAADAMRDAASNPSGGAGLTAGIGAGMGIGNLMQQATSGAMQQQAAGGKAPVVPDVMSPAEAAAILKVSEEDVMAAINDKSLKARKLGSSYRISKEALEDFLKS